MKIETIAQLIVAIIQVESGGNMMAVGDNGKAYGCMQIHAAYVEDVNRIWGTKFVHEDAFDKVAAIEMFLIYTGHYGVKLEDKLDRKATFEDLARIHNGGPNGWKKDSTKKYWEKVQQAHQQLYAGSPANPTSN